MKETIKLLDGKEWDRKELLDNMHSDDFYYGYLSKAALSSSSAKMLIGSPKTYHYVTKYGSPETQALRDGWLFHTAILEPDVFANQVFVDVESKNTKAYKLAKEKHGKVFTKKEKRDAERLADAFYKNEVAREYITKCDFEVPSIDEVMGFPFRGKADILGSDRIVDLKTTTDIRAFRYSADKYSYDMQCYLYCNLFNKTPKEFTFIALDKSSLDIGIFHCSDDFYFKGERKVEAAIETYKTFYVEGVDINEYYIEDTL